MRTGLSIILAAVVLAVPAGAEAKTHRHHHAKVAHSHKRAHKADLEGYELEVTWVGDEHVTTPEEEAENRAAVEAYEEGRSGEEG